MQHRDGCDICCDQTGSLARERPRFRYRRGNPAEGVWASTARPGPLQDCAPWTEGLRATSLSWRMGRETSLSTPTSALLRHGRLTPRFLMFPHALVVWRRLAVPAWGGGHVDGVRGRVGCSRVGLVHSRGWSHEFADAVLPFSCMRARLQEFLRTVVLSPAGWAFLGVCSSYPTCSSPFACSSHSFLVPFHEFLVRLHFPGREEKGSGVSSRRATLRYIE